MSSRRGVGVVWVTHDLDQIGRLAEYLLVMDNGRVKYSGSPGTAYAAAALETLSAEEPQ